MNLKKVLILEISLCWRQQDWTARPLDGQEKKRSAGKRNSEIRVPVVAFLWQMPLLCSSSTPDRCFLVFLSDCRELGKTQFSFFRPARTSGLKKTMMSVDKGKWNQNPAMRRVEKRG